MGFPVRSNEPSSAANARPAWPPQWLGIAQAWTSNCTGRKGECPLRANHRLQLGQLLAHVSFLAPNQRTDHRPAFDSLQRPRRGRHRTGECSRLREDEGVDEGVDVAGEP